jgi:hypothetical protein
MLGVQDFIGYYDWTFEYLRRKYGEDALRDYWGKAIGFDSQRHAQSLFLEKGLDGMQEYWAHTLAMEEAGYTLDRSEDHFRVDMFDCPSKGHLMGRGLEAYHDYCEHCMGWIRPLMDEAGFVVHHEHNHAGQCWWEMHGRRTSKAGAVVPSLRGPTDVRRHPNWKQKSHHLDLDSQPADTDKSPKRRRRS